MGWTSYASSKTQLVEDLTRPGRFNSNFTTIKHSLIGNNLWHLLLDKTTGFHHIHLDRISYFHQDGCWGYKDLPEECGPHETNCPIGFLKYPAQPEGYAINFRRRVEEHHNAKKNMPKAIPGMILNYGKHQFKLLESLGRKGWRVEHLNGGLYNRLTSQQLNTALRQV